MGLTFTNTAASTAAVTNRYVTSVNMKVGAYTLANTTPAWSGAGQVTVDLFIDGDRAVVEVTDDGAGIAAEHRDRIFLPFFTTKPSGTGLGMSIVKKIVDLHGGDIAIDSAPGRGTRVRISLPAAVAAPPPLAGGSS